MSDFLLQRGAHLLTVLERIAIAQERAADQLETIADAMLKLSYPPVVVNHPQPHPETIDPTEYAEKLRVEYMADPAVRGRPADGERVALYVHDLPRTSVPTTPPLLPRTLRRP